MSKDIKNDIDGIDDIQVLKDMLISQRKELDQRDHEVKTLEDTVNDLVSEIKNYKNLEQESVSELESKIYRLNKKITELEQENMRIKESSGKITSEQEYITNLENKIIEYDEKITSLEKVNKLHRDTIDKLRDDQSSMVTDLENKIKEQNNYVASLIKENRELLKKIEAKPDQPSVNIEENVIRLQKELANLKKENKELNEKNQVLKAALLLHVDAETSEVTDTTIKPIPAQIPKEPEREESITEIPTGKVQEIVSQRHAAMETIERVDAMKTEHVAEVPKGTVQELVKKRHAAMEAQEISVEPPEITIKLPEKAEESLSGEVINTEQEISTPMKEKVIETSPPQAAEVPDIEDIGVIETSDGRRKCPICGNENLRQIREVEDKTKIISAYPRMYGKKFKCGQCGAEWR